MDEALENFQDACDEDTPLNFCPLMAEFMGKLRRSLADSMESEFLLIDVGGTTRHPSPELSQSRTQWSNDVVFPLFFHESSAA